MMDPVATNAALARHYRRAKRMGWAQLGFSVLMTIGVIGDFRKEWVVLAYLATMACIALGALAMNRAKRLLQAQLAELGALRDEAGRRLGVALAELGDETARHLKVKPCRSEQLKP